MNAASWLKRNATCLYLIGYIMTLTKYEMKLTTDKLTYRIQLEERSAGKHNRSRLQHLSNASLTISAATEFVKLSFFFKAWTFGLLGIEHKRPTSCSRGARTMVVFGFATLHCPSFEDFTKKLNIHKHHYNLLVAVWNLWMTVVLVDFLNTRKVEVIKETFSR